MTTIVYIGPIVNGKDGAGRVVVIQEGESCNVFGTFYDGSSAIAKTALATVTCDLFVESSGVSINSRKVQDILDANNGVVSSGGELTLRLGPLDNIIVGTPDTEGYETHILRITWTWNDGIAVRTGIQEIRLYIESLTTVT